MSVLTTDQIEELKKTHPQKRILRFIFLFLGILMIVAGTAFLLLGVDFGIEVSEINISFVVDILIIIFGMIFASKYWMARYYLRENSLTIKRMRDLREPVKSYVKLNSFALSRLMAGLILIVVGIMNMLVFGMGVGHDSTRYGNAFVLGGPSWFYFTGLPALLIGVFLMLYVLLSVFRGTFSQSDNFYFFYELHPLCPWLTEIPKKDIEAIRYQNNHLGPKYAWIMLFMPFIIMQFQTGIPLFQIERAAPEYILSFTFVFTSILEIIAVIILVGIPQNYYEIATEDMLYEMWFSPMKMRGQEDLRQDLAKHFDCKIDERELESDPAKDSQSIFKDVSTTNFQLFNTIFGIVLIISGLIMLTYMVLFGPLFWWVALMYGFMLLFRAINNDFSRRGTDKFLYDEKNKTFKFERRFGYKFHYISANKVDSVSVRKWYRQLDFFDIFGLGGMLIMLMVQQVEGWGVTLTTLQACMDPTVPMTGCVGGVVPTYIMGLVTDNIISTVYMVIIYFFIFLYLCLPVDVIEFKTPSITYRTRITMKSDKGLLKKSLSNLTGLRKEVKKDDMKKTFRIRLIMILLLSGLALAYTVYNLISYFY